jgi:hypothetical protein
VSSAISGTCHAYPAKAGNRHDVTNALDGGKLYCDVSSPACTTCTMLLRTA